MSKRKIIMRKKQKLEDPSLVRIAITKFIMFIKLKYLYCLYE